MLLNENRNYIPVVTVANMDTDMAGELGQMVFNTTDSSIYVCTAAGAAGAATWISVALA